MVLRLLEYCIYNTSNVKIRVKFVLNYVEKSAYSRRVKKSISLYTTQIFSSKS